MKERMSGIIIHPTSFPGPYGCGDLGEDAYKVIDWLKMAGQKVLQVLSLGPTGFGDSPYSSFSAFAGNPFLISFNQLKEKGYLKQGDLDDYPDYLPERIEFSTLYIHKFRILRRAYQRFKQKVISNSYKSFCHNNQAWLDDYCLFMAIKNNQKGIAWEYWHPALKDKDNLPTLSENILDDSNFFKFIQWEFYQQWKNFKDYALEHGIKIIGDVPFNVLYDSSDVWAHQELFHLDENKKPQFVAGVPPDFFSETGQLWGNPCYNWEVMEKNDFHWWKYRIHNLLQFVDSVKIDHFRGFESYWSIPYGEKTAINGQWIKSPGYKLFNSFKKEFGDRLSDILIAEDLGVITDEVKALRDTFNIAGMRIFQMSNFEAIEKPDLAETETPLSFFKHDFIPENYVENCIAYPGTHDNDVLKGWFQSQNSERKKIILRYLGITDANDLNWSVIKKLLDSKANAVLFQVQDVLNLGPQTRMNFPGTCGTHNWSWRLLPGQLNDQNAEKLYNLTKKSCRV